MTAPDDKIKFYNIEAEHLADLKVTAQRLLIAAGDGNHFDRGQLREYAISILTIVNYAEALTALRGVAGRMTVGRPTGLAAAALGSGYGLNCDRQAGESWDFLATMQAVTRLISGISELHSRNASPVQACSCSGV